MVSSHFSSRVCRNILNEIISCSYAGTLGYNFNLNTGSMGDGADRKTECAISADKSALTVGKGGDTIKLAKEKTSHPINISSVLPVQRVQSLVKTWLTEDTPNFDYGGLVVGSKLETALLLIKSPGVVAGIPFFNAVFEQLNCTVEWLADEGDHYGSTLPVTMARVHGMCKNILLGERVALNCISRASGVATVTSKCMELVKDAGWKGKVAATRKTTPGFRLVEKYGLLVAGADTHRFDLSSMVMLKDNHIWSSGSITKAVENVKSVAGFSLKVEVECQSLDEGIEAAKAGADVVMFDNFSPKELHEAATALKSDFPQVVVEASGGIEESNITQYCGPHVDIISTSKLVQGYPTIDYSLKIVKS